MFNHHFLPAPPPEVDPPPHELWDEEDLLLLHEPEELPLLYPLLDEWV